MDHRQQSQRHRFDELLATRELPCDRDHLMQWAQRRRCRVKANSTCHIAAVVFVVVLAVVLVLVLVLVAVLVTVLVVVFVGAVDGWDADGGIRGERSVGVGDAGDQPTWRRRHR
ncbi:hypothetical protein CAUPRSCDRAFT_12928 [Caulochytrium protostelioides]|uniref:Uncharacterized protein n=1 Tax=Caulochytrium protostelioides TaxID=1555241 RepID=A0A4P9WRW3_9FUNG|nr:hypothetical protein CAUPRSCDRAFT_12928 [Caulochytrium protostelioides]